MSFAAIKFIVSAIAFVLSSGLLYSKKFRDNAVLLTIAGVIALVASVVLFQTLYDWFGPQKVKLSIAAYEARKDEGDSGTTNFLFLVTRSGRLTGTVTVDWKVSGGAADEADFGGQIPQGRVFFATGEDEQFIRVAVAGDEAIEENENFIVTLSNPRPDTIVLQNREATGTIRNDDRRIA